MTATTETILFGERESRERTFEILLALNMIFLSFFEVHRLRVYGCGVSDWVCYVWECLCIHEESQNALNECYVIDIFIVFYLKY